MSIDIPIVISYIYIFITMNLYGWGLLHDKRFIVFSVIVGLLYLASHILETLGKKLIMIRFRIFLLILFISISIFATTLNLIYLRNKTSVTGFINDSALQTEIAGKFLLLGKNPYNTPYKDSDLAKWKYIDDLGNKTNPALYQNVTPPLLILLSAAEFRIFSKMSLIFDFRIISLLACLLLLFIGAIKFKEHFLLFLIFVFLNPLFVNNVLEGSNDVVILALLLSTIFFLEKKRFVISSILLALAISTKQTAWFIVPFYLLYIFQNTKKSAFLKSILSLIITSVGFYLPFIIWDYQSVISNLILYVSSKPHLNLPIHPIEGLGFSSLLVSLRIIPTIYSSFPFGLYQLTIGGSLLLFLVYVQRKKITIQGLLYSYCLFLSVVWFFNRYFLLSHFAYLLIATSIAYLWSLHSKSSFKTSEQD